MTLKWWIAPEVGGFPLNEMNAALGLWQLITPLLFALPACSAVPFNWTHTCGSS